MYIEFFLATPTKWNKFVETKFFLNIACMKKLYLLAILALGMFATNAQQLNSGYKSAPGLQKLTNSLPKQRVNRVDASRASTNAVISYFDDNFNDYYADTLGKTFDLGYSRVNLRYANNANETYKYAVVLFDSLLNIQPTYPSVSLGSYTGKTVRVDSIEVIYFHNRTLTTKPDTLKVSVFDITQASITGSGAAANLTTVDLWSQTLNATGTNNFNALGNLVFNGGYSKVFPVNATLPAGKPFGVRVDYQGDTANKFNLIKGYRDDCGGACIYRNSTVEGNSLGYMNFTSGNTNLSGFSTLGNDCDANSSIEAATCEILYGDFWIIAYVTVSTPTPPTVVTNAASSITQATATLNGSVNANGVNSQTYFDWGLTTSYGNTVAGTPSSVSGTTATAISTGLTGLQPNTTYHFRARAVSADGTTNGQDLTFTTLASSGGTCTPTPGGTGFSPTSANIPCATNGQSFTQDISFAVPATIAGFAVTSATVDSIRNVPTGLTATLNQSPAVYTGGSSGCYRITGTPNAACGQYKILFYVTITGAFGTQQGELSALANTFSVPGFEPTFIRVVNSGVTCPAVNASQTANYASINCAAASITVSISKTDVHCNTKGTATATPSGGTNYSYAWSNGGNTATITGLNPGTYIVTVTETNTGATVVDSVTVNNVASTLTATATAGTQPGCGQSNGSASVTANGGTATYTYNWNSTPAQTSSTATGLSAGNYTVTVTDINGCTATANVTLSNPGAPTASVTGNNTICAGDTAFLKATGGTTYAWSNGLGSTANVIATPSTTTTYVVTVSNANGCSASTTFTVSVNPLPTPTITVSGTTLSTGTFSTYQWKLNNNNIANATSQTYTATQNGNYTVEVTDANGCKGTSAAQNVTGVGIKEANNSFAVTLMPNPNSGTFKLELNDNNTYDVTISNLIGEIIMTAKVQKEHTFVMNEAPKGIYLVNIRKEAASKTLKFTLIK